MNCDVRLLSLGAGMAGAGFAVRCGDQFVKDAAVLGPMLPIALGAQSHQLFFQRTHAFEAGAHAGELGADQVVHIAAIGRRRIHQREQAPDVSQGHVQRPAMAYKRQALQMRRRIFSVAIRLARGRGQQPLFFIKANGLNFHASGVAQCLDSNGFLLETKGRPGLPIAQIVFECP